MVLKRWLVLLLLLATSIGLAHAQDGEKRFALVIGNSDYQNVPKLPNPLNDATDMAALLRTCHFDVTLVTNATYSQIRDAMRAFHDKLMAGPKDETIGLFYYAGHGIQYETENYLIPTDANIQFADDIVRMGFPVQRMVLGNMERSNSALNVVILDACRNNPFPAATRAVAGGLAEVQKAKGAFIAYATAPGSVASDGSGRNGLYTQELLKAIGIPGLPIEQVFKMVRRNVLKLSGEKQYTWDSSNILGDFYFMGTSDKSITTSVAVATTSSPSTATEAPSRIVSKKIVTEDDLGSQLTKLTDSSIPFSKRQTARAELLKYFVVPHAFVNVMIGQQIDERIAANKLLDRLITLPETNIKVLNGEYADSGRIIELYIELEE